MSRLIEEFNYCVKTYDHFKSEYVDLEDYQFALIDNGKKVTEFPNMDDLFFQALLRSIRNLMVVGKKFDIEKFKSHKIFDEWFANYTNRI